MPKLRKQDRKLSFPGPPLCTHTHPRALRGRTRATSAQRDQLSRRLKQDSNHTGAARVHQPELSHGTRCHFQKYLPFQSYSYLAVPGQPLHPGFVPWSTVPPPASLRCLWPSSHRLDAQSGTRFRPSAGSCGFREAQGFEHRAHHEPVCCHQVEITVMSASSTRAQALGVHGVPRNVWPQESCEILADLPNQVKVNVLFRP